VETPPLFPNSSLPLLRGSRRKGGHAQSLFSSPPSKLDGRERNLYRPPLSLPFSPAQDPCLFFCKVKAHKRNRSARFHPFLPFYLSYTQNNQTVGEGQVFLFFSLTNGFFFPTEVESAMGYTFPPHNELRKRGIRNILLLFPFSEGHPHLPYYYGYTHEEELRCGTRNVFSPSSPFPSFTWKKDTGRW